MREDEELLLACKHALKLSPDTTALDAVLLQKIKMVKMFMVNAGVTNEAMHSDLAVGTLTLGVGDIWNSTGGEASFSPVFNTFVTQLAKTPLAKPSLAKTSVISKTINEAIINEAINKIVNEG